MPTPWFKVRIEELEGKLRDAEAALANALARIAELEAQAPASTVGEEPKPLNAGPDLDASPWLR